MQTVSRFTRGEKLTVLGILTAMVLLTVILKWGT